MFRILVEGAVVTCLLIITMSTLGDACSLDTCKRQEFREMVDQGPASTTVLTEAGPWPWKSCRRLCRQYLECLAFKIVWYSSGFGVCTIYKGMIKQADLVAEIGSSIYISCPGDLVWDEARDVCHSPFIQSRQFVVDALKTCRALYDYPGFAYPSLMTPRNPADKAWLNTFAAGFNVRLGIHRPAGARKFYFTFFTDEIQVTWFDWAIWEPDMTPAGADYVAAYDGAGQGHDWYDTPDMMLGFICEI